MDGQEACQYIIGGLGVREIVWSSWRGSQRAGCAVGYQLEIQQIDLMQRHSQSISSRGVSGSDSGR